LNTIFFMEIVNLSDNEIEICRKILNESFLTVANEFGLTKENSPTNAAFYSNNDLKGQIAKGILFYIGYWEGKAIGCVAIEKSKTELDTFYIEKLAVVPFIRHKGFGKKLMVFCFQTVKNMGGKTISIALVDSNSILKIWYKGLGFRVTGIKKFDHLPFDVCFMKKDLV
jgi:ribosomal protein S18 acetylase RimI-like enzyme